MMRAFLSASRMIAYECAEIMENRGIKVNVEG
jgi:hypothetical protein